MCVFKRWFESLFSLAMRISWFWLNQDFLCETCWNAIIAMHCNTVTLDQNTQQYTQENTLTYVIIILPVCILHVIAKRKRERRIRERKKLLQSKNENTLVSCTNVMYSDMYSNRTINHKNQQLLGFIFAFVFHFIFVWAAFTCDDFDDLCVSRAFVRFLYDVINWAGVLINKLLRLLYGASFFPPKYNNNIYELLLAICLCLLVLFFFSPVSICVLLQIVRSYLLLRYVNCYFFLFNFVPLFIHVSLKWRNFLCDRFYVVNIYSVSQSKYYVLFISLLFISNTKHTGLGHSSGGSSSFHSWSAHWISRWQQRAQKLYYLISIS